MEVLPLTVRDFLSMCTDDSARVMLWDVDAEVAVLDGTIRMAMDSGFASYDVETFDVFRDGKICLNVIID